MSDAGGLTPLEADYCGCLASNRLNLGSFSEGFALAVQLFELLERGGGPPSVGVLGGVFIQFRIIAAKEGAMNIFHFGNTLDAIRQQVPRCPTARGVDAKALRASWQRFERSFPHWESTRHAVAHMGEIWKTPEAAAKHWQKRDYASAGGHCAAGGFLAAMLYERVYSIGWEGNVFEVRMDQATVRELREITTQAYLAFQSSPAPASDALPPSRS